MSLPSAVPMIDFQATFEATDWTAAESEAAKEVGHRSAAEAMPQEERQDTSGPRPKQQSGPQQKKKQQQQQTKSGASTSGTEWVGGSWAEHGRASKQRTK